jgi:hypothetical protein
MPFDERELCVAAERSKFELHALLLGWASIVTPPSSFMATRPGNNFETFEYFIHAEQNQRIIHLFIKKTLHQHFL